MFEFIHLRYPALAESSYVKYFVGSLAAVSGTQLVTLGQLWLMYELTGSALMLGWLGAAVALPNLAINLFGGVIADRYNKRLILIYTAAANGLFTAILTSLVFTDLIEPWHILFLAGLTSLANGLDWPTRVAIFPQLVPQSAYPSAVALNAFIWQVTRLVIPAIAGVMLAFLGAAITFFVAVHGFVFMCFTMLFVKSRSSVSARRDVHALLQIREGLGFIWNNNIFKYLLLLTFVGMFFCNSHTQLMPIFAELTGQGEIGLGLLLAAGGLGSIAGTLYEGGRQQSKDIGGHILVSATLAALTTIAFAAVSMPGWFIAAVLLQLLAAYYGALFQIGAMTVMQLRVPSEIRGRVMGIHTMGYSLLPGGALFLGAISEISNVLIAVAVGSLVYLIFIGSHSSSKSTIRQLGVPQPPVSEGSA